MGRFISSDTYPSPGQGLLGNNMFAYCGNNPTARIDSSGYFWEAIGIGFVAGVVGQYVSDVMGNIKDGETGVGVLAFSSSGSEYLAAGIGGAIAATPGLKIIGTMAVGALGNVVSDSLKGNINGFDDLKKSALKGGVANAIGYGIAKGIATLKLNQISNMSRSSRKVYLRDNFYCNSQAQVNNNLRTFANASMSDNIKIIETQFFAFKSGVYSTVTSTLATLF